MKNIFTLIILAVFLFTLTACKKMDKPAILFNKNKITVDNVMDYSFVFKPNERIYYLILLPKKIKTDRIDIQIIKKDNKYERLGYKLAWSYSARLYDDEIYYYDDYVVLSETGAYIMKVYSKDEPTKLLCVSQFYVKN